MNPYCVCCYHIFNIYDYPVKFFFLVHIHNIPGIHLTGITTVIIIHIFSFTNLQWFLPKSFAIQDFCHTNKDTGKLYE